MAANPPNPTELYAALLTAELAGLSSTESLEVIGSLIDLSDDLGKPDGARRALELSDLLGSNQPPGSGRSPSGIFPCECVVRPSAT